MRAFKALALALAVVGERKRAPYDHQVRSSEQNDAVLAQTRGYRRGRVGALDSDSGHPRRD